MYMPNAYVETIECEIEKAMPMLFTVADRFGRAWVILWKEDKDDGKTDLTFDKWLEAKRPELLEQLMADLARLAVCDIAMVSDVVRECLKVSPGTVVADPYAAASLISPANSRGGLARARTHKSGSVSAAR
jgi:hypothetical protein